MNTRCALAVALILAAGSSQLRAENPYAKAKIGDYYTFKTMTKIAGIATEGVLTQTVTAKDEKEATILVTGKLLAMGMEVMIPSKTETIDLTKPYDPTQTTGNLPPGAMVTVEKVRDGAENLVLNRVKYETTWTMYKLKMKNMGMDFEADMKVWQTKTANVPMVKMEMSSQVMDNRLEVTMELQETGNKPVDKGPEKK